MASEEFKDIIKDVTGELRTQFLEKIQQDNNAKFSALRAQIQGDIDRRINDRIASVATRMEKGVDSSLLEKSKIITSLESRVEGIEKAVNSSLTKMKDSLAEILSEKELEVQNKINEFSSLIDAKVYESNSHLLKGLDDVEKLLTEKIDETNKMFGTQIDDTKRALLSQNEDFRKTVEHEIGERLDENRSNYESLENRSDSIQSDLKALRNSLEKAENSMYSLESDLSGLIDEKLSRARMSNAELANNMDALNKRLASLKADIDAKVGRADLDGLSRTIRSDIDRDMEAFEGKVESWLDDRIGEKVGEVEDIKKSFSKEMSVRLDETFSEYKDKIDERINLLGSEIEASNKSINLSVGKINEKISQNTEEVGKLKSEVASNIMSEVNRKINENAAYIRDLGDSLRKSVYNENRTTLDTMKTVNKEEILGEVHKVLKESLNKNFTLIGEIDAKVVNAVTDVKNQLLLYKNDIENLHIKHAEFLKILRELDLKLNQSIKTYGNIDKLTHDIFALRKDSQEKTGKINSLIDVFNTSQTKFVNKLIDLENQIRKLSAEFYGHSV